MTLELKQIARADLFKLPGFLVERHYPVQGFCTETLLAKNTVQ